MSCPSIDWMSEVVLVLPESVDKAGELGRDLKSEAISRDAIRHTGLGPSSSKPLPDVIVGLLESRESDYKQ